MGYTPENNPYIPGDPYSYDLKWLVERIKHQDIVLEGLPSMITNAVISAFNEHDPIYYNSAADMIAADQKPGSLAYIMGYYNKGDGGACLYYITDNYAEMMAAEYYIQYGSSYKWAIPVIIDTFVKPEIFGAVGDGITDDTEAVKTAFNHRYVFLTNTYLTDSIVIDHDITVNGAGTLYLKDDADITSSGVYNIIFDGCSFDFRRTVRSSAPMINIENAAYAEIVNCILTVANYKGVIFKNCVRGEFNNNIAVGDGSIIEYSQTHGNISGNKLRYSAAADSDDYHSIDVRINNSAVYFINIKNNDVRSYANCIQCSSISGASVRFVDIAENVLYSSVENAFKFDGVKNGYVHDNTVDGCLYVVGVLGSNGSTANLTLKNNRFLDFKYLIKEICSDYIGHTFSGDLVIENNYIQSPTYYGSTAFLFGGTNDTDAGIRTEKLHIIFKNNTINKIVGIFNNNSAQRHINNADIDIIGNIFTNMGGMGEYTELWPNTNIKVDSNEFHTGTAQTTIRWFCDGKSIINNNLFHNDQLASIRMIGQLLTAYTFNVIQSTRSPIDMIWKSGDGTIYPTTLFDNSNRSNTGRIRAYPYTPDGLVTNFYRVEYTQIT